MNWLDILIIILLIAAAVGGVISGLIRTIFSLAGLIVGVVLAGRYYITFADYLRFISNDNAARIVAFIIIFLAVMIIATLLGVLLTRLMSAVFLGWINRLLGAVLGVFLGSIFIAAILAIWVKYVGDSSAITHSFIAQIFLDRLPLILALLPEEFDTIRQFFR